MIREINVHCKIIPKTLDDQLSFFVVATLNGN